MSERASDPRPPWRELFDEAALRRLARLASLRGGEELVWLGSSGQKPAKQLERICATRVKVRPDLEGIPKRSLSLIVAPEIVEQVGLDAALEQLRSALETDGVLALVLRTANGDGVPEEQQALWERRQHGPLGSIMHVLGRFSALGLEPMTAEFPSARGEPKGQVTVTAGSGGPLAAEHGVRMGLFIGRRVEPGSPPRWPRRAGME